MTSENNGETYMLPRSKYINKGASKTKSLIRGYNELLKTVTKPEERQKIEAIVKYLEQERDAIEETL